MDKFTAPWKFPPTAVNDHPTLAPPPVGPPPDVRSAPLLDLTTENGEKSALAALGESYFPAFSWAATDGIGEMAQASAFNVARGRDAFEYTALRHQEARTATAILSVAPVVVIFSGLYFALQDAVRALRSLLGLPSNHPTDLQIKAIHEVIQTASAKGVPCLRLLVSRAAGCRIEERLYGMSVKARACSTQGKLILEVEDD